MKDASRTTGKGKVIFQIECPVCGREGLLHLQQQYKQDSNLSVGQLSVWHAAMGWPRKGGVHYLAKSRFPEVYDEYLPEPGPGQVVEEGEEQAVPAGGREVAQGGGC